MLRDLQANPRFRLLSTHGPANADCWEFLCRAIVKIKTDGVVKMKKINEFFGKIRESIRKIPLKSYVTFLLEGIGLLANIIALVSYFGASNTPKTSPNFYINNQEFFAWSTLAVVYTLGIILARMKRRWRRIYGHENDGRSLAYQIFVRGPLRHADWLMYKRNFSFTLVIGFPIIFLYVRAIQTSLTSGTASPWSSLLTTTIICIPINLAAMIVSSIFDNALSLYEGD